MTPLTLQADVQLDLAARDGAAPKQPTFSILAYSGAPMRLEGWPYPVVLDLAGLDIPAHVAVLLDHDQRAIVGQGVARVEGSTVRLGGVVTGDPAAPGDPAHTVVEHAKRGFKWAASIGAAAHKTMTYPARDARVKVNGQEHAGPVIVVTAARLGEVSFVAAGADARATAEVKAKMGPNENNVEIVNDPALLERQRVREIRAACGGEYADVETQAIEAGWSPERTRATLLERVRASRPKAPHVRAGVAADVAPRDVLAAAGLDLLGRRDLAEQVAGGRAIEAARALHATDGVRGLVRADAHLHGRETERDYNTDLRASFGASTGSLPTALSEGVSRVALDFLKTAEPTYAAISALQQVRDFRPVKLNRLVVGGGLEPVAPGGEIKHGTLDEENYDAQADTLGRMIVVTRKDLINDDLGQLARLGQAIGRMAVRAVQNAVFGALLAGKLLDGNDFFVDGQNHLEGVDTALGFTSLALAVKMHRDRVDAAGDPIDSPPAVLLVPPSLEVTARQLLNSESVARDTDAEGDLLAQGNPFKGALQLVVEPRLANEKFTGASDKQWFLSSRPEDGGIVIVTLTGALSPIIETVDLPGNVLGFGMRGVLDFGVALADGRCVTRVKGEA